MSLPQQTDWSIPSETVRLARAAFPKGSSVLHLRDELGVLYDDQDCAALFATRGQPAESPSQILLVLVLQGMDGLTGRQAADAVRGRIDWTYTRWVWTYLTPALTARSCVSSARESSPPTQLTCCWIAC